jgi:hypothetical protein
MRHRSVVKWKLQRRVTNWCSRGWRNQRSGTLSWNGCTGTADGIDMNLLTQRVRTISPLNSGSPSQSIPFELGGRSKCIVELSWQFALCRFWCGHRQSKPPNYTQRDGHGLKCLHPFNKNCPRNPSIFLRTERTIWNYLSLVCFFFFNKEWVDDLISPAALMPISAVKRLSLFPDVNFPTYLFHSSIFMNGRDPVSSSLNNRPLEDECLSYGSSKS